MVWLPTALYWSRRMQAFYTYPAHFTSARVLDNLNGYDLLDHDLRVRLLIPVMGTGSVVSLRHCKRAYDSVERGGT